MKNLLLTAIIALTCSGLFASSVEKEVKSETTHVTVFLKGAEITRKSAPFLEIGDYELKFKSLEKGILKESIQVDASEDLIILGVSHQLNYLKGNTDPKATRMMRDSIGLLEDQIAQINYEMEAYQLEQKLILANQDLKSEKEGVSISELKEAADFFRSRLIEIQKQLFHLKKNKTRAENRKSTLNFQLQVITGDAGTPSPEITVKVRVTRASSRDIILHYIVRQAGWIPSYDLRAVFEKDEIQLDYRATVWQLTGSDWKNISLTLSTGNPMKDNTQPTMSIWSLFPAESQYLGDGRFRGYYKPQGMTDKAMVAGDSISNEMQAYNYVEEDEKRMSGEGEILAGIDQTITLGDFTSINPNGTTTEYSIKLNQDLASHVDGEVVMVRQSTLPVCFEHFSIPKVDKDAFLMARVTNWEDLNLLPGNANIFFEGSYVGQAFINPTITFDTLNFSMGRDKGVVIDRTRKVDETENSFFGGKTERTFVYEIKIRNTKGKKVKVTIEDQIPVSKHEDIVVTLIDGSGARHDKERGKLIWSMDIAPKESKMIRFEYKVKFPKGEIPANLTM